jgi:hypothetical protein
LNAWFPLLVDPTLQLNDKIDSNIQGHSQNIKASGIGSFDGQSELFETIQSNVNIGADSTYFGKND